MRGKLFRSLVISGVFLLIYTYRLGTLFAWDTDWSRDLYDTAKLATGNITLIGPALTGAVFAGPYYYYSLVPQLRISGFNENVILHTNAIVFAITVGITSFILGTWGAFFIGLMPFWIMAARHPGNAYSYLPLLLVLLLTAKLNWRKFLHRQLEWGLLAGLIANFHPASMVIIAPLGLWKSIKSRNLWWLTTFTACYMPLLAFEVKHKGIMINAVLSGKFWNLVTSKTGEGLQIHYLLPVLLIATFVMVNFITRRFPVLIKVAILIILMAIFPTGIYKSGYTSSPKYEQVVNATITAGMVDLNRPFNILGINDIEKKVVSANEFRYFLWKKGYRPLPNTEFTQAEQIIVFSRIKTDNLSEFETWELNQFSRTPKIQQAIAIDGYYVYRISKN